MDPLATHPGRRLSAPMPAYGAPPPPPPPPGWARAPHGWAPPYADAAPDHRHRPYPPLHQFHAAAYAGYAAYPQERSPPRQHSPPQLPRRARCTQACNHCHRRKARCVRNAMPDGTFRCDNCIREDIPCEWRASRRRGPKRRRQSADPSPPRAATNAAARHYVLPSLDWPQSLRAPDCAGLVGRFMATPDVELREAVLAYYAYFYGFCPILHPSSLLRKVVAGTLCPLLADSLRATTSMFVTAKLGCKINTEQLFTRLVSAITIRPEAPSVDEVCAFQLASIGVSGVRGFVCFDTLKSAVTGLLIQLNWHQLDRHESLTAANSWDEWVEAEVKRRVFWINYKVDSHHASIAGRPPSIDEDSVFVRAPCSDADWDELSRAHLAAHCCRDPASHPPGPWTTDPWPAALTTTADHNDGGDDDDDDDDDDRDDTGGEDRIPCRVLALSVQEELSRTFRQITPYEGFMARISTLQRDAKAAWVQRCRQAAGGRPAEPVPLLGDSAQFRQYDAELREWKAAQVRASDLRDPGLAPWDASFFGTVRQRIFLVRVRYYCLNIYAPAVTILLHSSNRRSFCIEAQQQALGAAAIATSVPPDNNNAPPSPESGSASSRQGSEEAEEQAITRILNQSFGPLWCQGLIARDIEPASWDLSVACAHELADCLRANSDIPLEFVDMVIPLFFFVGITVLLRQYRKCKAVLRDDQGASLLGDAERREWDAELQRCLRDAHVQLQAIRDMGTVWRVEGLARLLANMHIDEVEKAAEQLSSICI
ncbi:hypothetical protein H4R18_005108 [Coemansia javaensis]|uniref:Zn(2)-C6 fungal-type domain-containing protein n=1 Tax=Coemansia javaensis TaxID=2761396 RepID=A0A9W8H485_9FUNG|nr:hypothetical protein H4R18_005108 [Coemansia javaensis]